MEKVDLSHQSKSDGGLREKGDKQGSVGQLGRGARGKGTRENGEVRN